MIKLVEIHYFTFLAKNMNSIINRLYLNLESTSFNKMNHLASKKYQACF